MKYLPAFMALFSTIHPLSAYAEGRSAAHPVVLELFTSQGCSSCPPADRLVSKYADYAGVLVLSYHVDYWDYIGWKDPYSSAKNTNRQREYASYLRSRNVYTPQAIIQGKSDVVGSNESGLANALSIAAKNGSWIAAKLEKSAEKVAISLPATENINAKILLVGYQKQSSNAVPRGENAGEQLAHRNSVTDIIPLGEWKGAAFNITKPLPTGDGVAVLIQSAATGEIIGANWQ